MKKNKYFKIIIVVIIILLIFLLKFIISDHRKLSIPERLLKDGVTTIEKIIYAPVQFTTSKIEKWNETKKLQKALEKNEEKIKSYDLLENRLKETEKQLNELEQTLQIQNNFSDYTVINTTIIHRNVGTWYDSLTIDKGSKDGIIENMAAITSYGLVGKVMKVTEHSSEVKLLTSVNESFQISVKIEINGQFLYGLLSNYKKPYLIITGISDNSEIPKNSPVTTTGLDNLFPSGILIGYTDQEEKDNFDLARTIYVAPVHSMDDINYISILKRREE